MWDGSGYCAESEMRWLGTAEYRRQFLATIARRALLFAAADKRSVFVVVLVRDALVDVRRGTIWRGGSSLAWYEFHFVDQAAPPSLVDASAEIAGHVLELLSPGFGVSGDVEPAALASQRARVAGESLPHDLRPGAR